MEEATILKLNKLIHQDTKTDLVFYFFRTTGTSREELSSIQVRQDDGLYISTANDLIFYAANIKFNNARLRQGRTPTADDEAATKKYADDGLSLKVDKTEIPCLSVTQGVVIALCLPKTAWPPTLGS